MKHGIPNVHKKTGQGHPWVHATILAFFVVAAACDSPSMIAVQSKERVSHGGALSGLGQGGWKEDKFAFMRSAGLANILWVVDNSPDAESYLRCDHARNQESLLEQLYDAWMDTLEGKPSSPRTSLTRLNVAMQVITTPSHTAPAQHYFGPRSREAHHDNLFYRPQRTSLNADEGGMLISNTENRGQKRARTAPTPIASALKGFASLAFKNRAQAHNYAIFVLARDSDRREQLNASSLPNSEQPLGSVRLLALAENNKRALARSFPLFTSGLSALLFNSSKMESLNLNDSVGINVSRIARWIEDGQKALQLSAVPKTASELVVKVNNQVLGSDKYRYDSTTNTVVLVDNAAAFGDEITIHYGYRPSGPGSGNPNKD